MRLLLFLVLSVSALAADRKAPDVFGIGIEYYTFPEDANPSYALVILHSDDCVMTVGVNGVNHLVAFDQFHASAPMPEMAEGTKVFVSNGRKTWMFLLPRNPKPRRWFSMTLRPVNR